MGTIDKKHFRLTCHDCAAQEYKSVRETGGAWGSGGWDTPTFSKFEVEVFKDILFVGKDPEVTRAKCKACGSQHVEIDTDMNLGKPKWEV